MTLEYFTRGGFVMVQSISAASSASTQIGSATATTGTSSASFDSILNGVSTTGTSDQTQDSSETSDSKSTSGSQKASSAQTTTCGKCGAVYQGDNAPAICTKCGNDMSAQNSGSQDPNSLLDTSGASNPTNATDSASAVSTVGSTSETGNNMAQFDFSNQMPATISLQ